MQTHTFIRDQRLRTALAFQQYRPLIATAAAGQHIKPCRAHPSIHNLPNFTTHPTKPLPSRYSQAQKRFPNPQNYTPALTFQHGTCILGQPSFPPPRGPHLRTHLPRRLPHLPNQPVSLSRRLRNLRRLHLHIAIRLRQLSALERPISPAGSVPVRGPSSRLGSSACSSFDPCNLPGVGALGLLPSGLGDYFGGRLCVRFPCVGAVVVRLAPLAIYDEVGKAE